MVNTGEVIPNSSIEGFIRNTTQHNTVQGSNFFLLTSLLVKRAGLRHLWAYYVTISIPPCFGDPETAGVM